MFAALRCCQEQRGRLTPTWAPQGATVPHRRNGGVRADAPQGTMGHIASDGGSIKLNDRAAAPRTHMGPCRRSGNLPGEASRSSRGARREAEARETAPQPWRTTVPRGCVAPKPGSGPTWQRRTAAAALDGSANWCHGRYAPSAAASCVLECRTADLPLQLSFPTPAPGASRSPGARRSASCLLVDRKRHAKGTGRRLC